METGRKISNCFATVMFVSFWKFSNVLVAYIGLVTDSNNIFQNLWTIWSKTLLLFRELLPTGLPERTYLPGISVIIRSIIVNRTCAASTFSPLLSEMFKNGSLHTWFLLKKPLSFKKCSCRSSKDNVLLSITTVGWYAYSIETLPGLKRWVWNLSSKLENTFDHSVSGIRVPVWTPVMMAPRPVRWRLWKICIVDCNPVMSLKSIMLCRVNRTRPLCRAILVSTWHTLDFSLIWQLVSCKLNFTFSLLLLPYFTLHTDSLNLVPFLCAAAASNLFTTLDESTSIHTVFV